MCLSLLQSRDKPHDSITCLASSAFSHSTAKLRSYGANSLQVQEWSVPEKSFLGVNGFEAGQVDQHCVARQAGRSQVLFAKLCWMPGFIPKILADGRLV